MIFLTSNTPPVIGDLYNRFLKDKNLKGLVFIETAAEVESGDLRWLEDDYNALLGTGLEITRYTVTGKDTETLKKDLSAYDVIYVSGGNTFYLLQQMQKSGALEVIRELIQNGKTYIGTSAGSVVAGPDISPVRKLDSEEKAPELNGYKGLALVDVVVFPHWGSPSFKEAYLEKGLTDLYNNPVHKTVLLTDNQYLYVNEEGCMKILP